MGLNVVEIEFGLIINEIVLDLVVVVKKFKGKFRVVFVVQVEIISVFVWLVIKLVEMVGQ